MKNKQVTTEDIMATIARRKTVKGAKIRWELSNPHKFLRATIPDYEGEFCPITLFVLIKTGNFFWVGNVSSAARCISLEEKTWTKIVDAADKSYGYSKLLRKKLLQATGLL